jgi:hypothetical protein
MTQKTKEKKALSIFAKGAKELYIIEGDAKYARNQLSDMRWSPKYNELKALTTQQIREQLPQCLNATPQVGELIDQQCYDESVLGIIDDNGYAATKNKEHAKLMFKEYQSFCPKAKVSHLSLPFDPEEEVDTRYVIRKSLDFDPLTPGAFDRNKK